MAGVSMGVARAVHRAQDFAGSAVLLAPVRDGMPQLAVFRACEYRSRSSQPRRGRSRFALKPPAQVKRARHGARLELGRQSAPVHSSY